MTSDWAALCQAPDMTREGNFIDVTFGTRRHRVAVEDCGDSYMLSAVVARQATTAAIPDLQRIWQRNRVTALVGFRIDNRRRLVGEAWVPKVGLTPDEFQLYVRTVAADCDRLEYVLTGRDVE